MVPIIFFVEAAIAGTPNDIERGQNHDLPKHQPHNGKLFKTFDELTGKQLETALATVDPSFRSWRHMTLAERSGIAAKAGAVKRARVDEFARPIRLEVGKLTKQARDEVMLSVSTIDYNAKNAEAFPAPQHLKPTSGEAQPESTPFDVLFGVQAWNFPYYQLAHFVAPNLMAGNVAMMKHAGFVSQCAIASEKLRLEAGAPEGAYTNLLISYDQVNRVSDGPRIKAVAYTGNVEAGKKVACRAGQNLKKSKIEFGGSDALIVLEDADLNEASKCAVWSNMEQSCVAAKRFIVVEELADRFLDKFQTAMAAFKPANPINKATALGPPSTDAALVKLQDQVKGAVAQWATVAMVCSRRSWRTSSQAIRPSGRKYSGRSRFSSESRKRTKR